MNDSMEILKQMICKELDEIAEKGEMSPGDLDVITSLLISKEKLLKIEKLEGEGGYSEGDWSANGSYSRGNSYANMYDRGGAYSEGRGYSREGYSRAADDIRMKVNKALKNGDFTNAQRQSIQRILDEM